MANLQHSGLRRKIITSLYLLLTFLYINISHASPPKVIVIDVDDILFSTDIFKYRALAEMYKQEGLCLENLKTPMVMAQLDVDHILTNFKNALRNRYKESEVRQKYLAHIEEQGNLAKYVIKAHRDLFKDLAKYNIPLVLIGSLPKELITASVDELGLSPMIYKIFSRPRLNHNMTFVQIYNTFNCQSHLDMWCCSTRPQVLYCMLDKDPDIKSSRTWLGYPIYFDQLSKLRTNTELCIMSEPLIEKEKKAWNLKNDHFQYGFARMRIKQFSALIFILQSQKEESSEDESWSFEEPSSLLQFEMSEDEEIHHQEHNISPLTPDKFKLQIIREKQHPDQIIYSSDDDTALMIDIGSEDQSLVLSSDTDQESW